MRLTLNDIDVSLRKIIRAQQYYKIISNVLIIKDNR